MGRLVLLFLLLVPSSSHLHPHPHHTGQGFDLLFSDNLDTYKDTPIFFEQPTPQWSQGAVIRNGLGQFSMGTRKVMHSFDAFGKLSKVSLNGSNVALFSHQFINTDFYQQSVDKGTIAPFMLFESPKPKYNFWERLVALVNGCDNTNVNILRFGKSASYFANSDFWQIYNVNGTSLDTLDKVPAPLPAGVEWSRRFPLPSTSHPVQEYGSENYISFVNVMNPLPFGQATSINVVRMTSLKQRELIASIPMDKVPYMHAFGLSKNYAIIFANPAFIDLFKVVFTGNAVSSIEWKPELGTDIYVVHIHTGKVQKFHSRHAECNLHFVNAWERKNKIFVDYINYRDMNLVKSMEVDTLKNATKRDAMKGAPRLVRYKFNLKKGVVRRKQLGKRSSPYAANHFDFPRINPAFQFKRYCYVYGVAMRSDKRHIASTSLVKKDVCGGRKDMVVSIPDHYFQEPQFVPRPNTVTEDDGILIVLALDGRKQKSYVAIYDASRMVQINKAWLPTVVPFSLHGNYFPGQV